MHYATLMVHMALGRPNTAVLNVTANLAEQFHAGVIGIAACQPPQLIYSDGIYIPGTLVEDTRIEIDREMQAAEMEFRSVLQARIATITWRSDITLAPISAHLAREARGADLFSAGRTDIASKNQPTHESVGGLILQLGRPALIVPDGSEKPGFKRIVVAWKDTREARRAILDALPLLKQADHVAVVELAEEENMAAASSHLEDISAWLKGHGISAQMLPLPSIGAEAAQLHSIILQHDADLVVAGAYGHSRLHEWLLGGVTSDLLLKGDCCAFVSY